MAFTTKIYDQNCDTYLEEDLQIEFLIPHRIQFLRHRPGPLLYFTYLYGDVRI